MVCEALDLGGQTINPASKAKMIASVVTGDPNRVMNQEASSRYAINHCT